MESRDLRIFYMVALEKNMTKAASRLGYVQSNVTARIQHLEAEVNTPLFYRSKKGMFLTHAGEKLFKYTQQILNLMDEALKSVQYAEIPSGPLSLGSSETTAAVHLPGLLKNYHNQYPQVKLSLITGHPHDLLQKVLDYQLDGAFVNGSIDHPDIERIMTFEEELVLVSNKAEENIQELMKKTMLFLAGGCAMRTRLEKWFEEEKMTLENVMEFGTLEAILGGVSAGLGISLLPKSSITRMEEQGLVRSHPIPVQYRQFKVYFIYRKDRFQTRAFEELLHSLKMVQKGKVEKE